MTVTPRERSADPDDDPVESMLKKAGCLELHYKIQRKASTALNQMHLKKCKECIATTKDWRKCQNEVNDFRVCIEKHKQQDNMRIKN